MNPKSNIDERIRAEAAIIERIAKQFASGSLEVEALKRCMLAYGFCLMKYPKEFESYLARLDCGPSDEEQKLPDQCK